MATYETLLEVTESNIDIANNQSKISVTFKFRRTDAGWWGYNMENTAYFNIRCNGTASGNTPLSYNWNIAQGVWQTIGSKTFTVTHSNDGTLKNISISGYFYFGDGVQPSSLSGNRTFTGQTIPRYTSFTTWDVTSITQNSATFSWKTADTVKAIEKSTNSGSTWQSVSTTEGTSGTFTQTGLLPKTNYKIKIRAQRKDSSLWTESSEKLFTTQAIAYITNSSINMNIGSNLVLNFAEYNNNKSFLRLYVENDAGTYVLVKTETGIQAASYTWNLSSIATTLYGYCKTKNKMNFKIECGVNIGGKDYINTKTGIMSVVNSNPTFTAYTFSNTEATVANVVGVENMIQNYGNMQVQVSSTNKAVAKNSADIVKYVFDLSEPTSGYTNTFSCAYSATAQVVANFGALQNAGTYTISAKAVDSRGNYSPAVSKTFVVYPYHKPNFKTIQLDRLNNYEKEITLQITALISRVVISSVEKNSVVSMKYRYAEDKLPLPTTYTAITGYTTANTNDDKTITVNFDQNNLFLQNLDAGKAYNFEFILTDKFMDSIPIPAVISQGVSPFFIGEEGLVAVNVIPDFSNPCDLQVGTDILAKDTLGNTRKVFETMEKSSVLSSTQPSNQLNGGIWLKQEKTVSSTACGTISQKNESSVYKNFYPNTLASLVKMTNGKSVEDTLAGLFDLIVPVGTVIENADSKFNPNTLYTGTTWTRIKGKVLVGVDENDADFSTASKTGGIKKTNHVFYRPPINSNNAQDAGLDYVNSINGRVNNYLVAGGSTSLVADVQVTTAGGTIRTNGKEGVEAGFFKYTSNNLQPYETVFIWKRTA